MSRNKKADKPIVKAFVKSGLSTAEAIEQLLEVEKYKRQKKKQAFQASLISYLLWGTCIALLLFALWVGQS